MKALSIKQPYIQRILTGHKTLEIRSWKTRYRGDILLCASQKPEIGYSLKEFNNLGCAVGIAELVSIFPYLPEHLKLSDSEHFTSGLFAWHLKNIRIISAFPLKGKLGLFDVSHVLL